MIKKNILSAVLVGILIFSGCSKKNEISSIEYGLDSNLSYGAWIAYWDLEQVNNEIIEFSESIEEIYYFAAYFDENGNLFIPENITKSKNELSVYAKKAYLTIVNDISFSDGTSKLKDTEILNNIFQDDKLEQKHIEQIVNLAKDNGYDGIELDYEAIRSNVELWHEYIDFIEKIYETALGENLKVRVLLEPSVPEDEINLPKGPEYIMMCYNLYGYGTKAGPKASEEFLIKMVNKMQKISEDRGFALATGGFDFSKDKVLAITTEEATKLSKGKKIYRDEASQAVWFEYNDQDGKKHEVWFSDSKTIGFWSDVLKQNGESKISIWRLGGI